MNNFETLKEISNLNLRLKFSIERMEEFQKLKAPEFCIKHELNIQKEIQKAIALKLERIFISESIKDMIKALSKDIEE